MIMLCYLLKYKTFYVVVFTAHLYLSTHLYLLPVRPGVKFKSQCGLWVEQFARPDSHELHGENLE